MINSAQAKALAALMAALHPGWDIPGCAAAIHRARHRGTPAELAHAAIRLAERADLRTPMLLAEDGSHWRPPPGTASDPIHFDRCPEIGHTSFPKWNCSACAADKKARTDDAPRDIRPGGVPMPDTVRAHIDRLKERTR